MSRISLCRKVMETAEIVLTHKRSLLDSTAVSSTRRMKDVLGAEPPTLQDAETQYARFSTRYLARAESECILGSHQMPSNSRQTCFPQALSGQSLLPLMLLNHNGVDRRSVGKLGKASAVGTNLWGQMPDGRFPHYDNSLQ